MPAATFTVVMISPHHLMNDLLRSAIDRAPDIRTCVIAESIEQAVADARDVVPDVAVLGVLSATTNEARAAVRAVLRSWPTTSVIVLARSEDDEALFEALFVGACGFLTLDSSADEAIAAVRHAGAHELVFNPAFARRLLDEVRDRAVSREASGKGASALSARELEVLRMVAQGHSNQRIATEMNVSPSTVKNHLYSVYQKIGVTSRSQAVAQAVKLRLLTL